MSGLLKGTLLGIALSLAFASVASAQGIPGVSQPISIEIAPLYPAPGDTIYVTAQSYSTDLNRAQIDWYVNGALYAHGTGLTNITVKTSRSGPTDVSVKVSTVDIGEQSASLSVRPASVTLLWQADGYVPPFYAGKALEAYGSAFKVTAIPEFASASGGRVNPKTLIYTWKKNGTVDGAQSGYGKDSYVGEQSSYLRGGDEITVNVTSPSTSGEEAQGSVTISPTAPDIELYKDSPLNGIEYEEALPSSYSLSEQEIAIKAEPFYMSTNDPLGGALTFGWTMNGAAVPAFQDKNEITLRSTGAPGTQTDIGVAVQHKAQILQGGNASITITQ